MSLFLTDKSLQLSNTIPSETGLLTQLPDPAGTYAHGT